MSDLSAQSLAASKGNVARSSLVFGSTTLVSRILGMFRDVAIANAFGAGIAADAFYVAFRFANLFRAFFAEGAFTQAFVPNLALVAIRDPEHMRLFIGNICMVLGGALLTLVLLFELLIDELVGWYAFGYRDNPHQLQLVKELLQITLPYVLLISLAALLSAVLQNQQRFFVAGFSPVVLNICMIAAALLGGQYFAVPVHALAWATVAAGCLQLLMPLVQVAYLRLMPVFRWGYWHDSTRKTILMFGPVVITASVTQLALLVDTLLATFLPTGSVTWLYIANRLIGFPLGIFGVSIAVVVLPAVSRARSSGNIRASQGIFGWAVGIVSSIAIPASVALAVVPEAIVITLFQYGAFVFDDAMQAAMALRLYAPGLIGMMLLKILVSQFLAVGDARTPLYTAVGIGLAGVVCSLVLMQFFAHLGIALATAVTSLAQATVIYLLALRRGLVVWHAGSIRVAFRILIASAAMALVCWLLFDSPQAWSGFPLVDRIVRLSGYIALAVGCYVAVMLMLGWRMKQLRSPF